MIIAELQNEIGFWISSPSCPLKRHPFLFLIHISSVLHTLLRDPRQITSSNLKSRSRNTSIRKDKDLGGGFKDG